MKGIMNSLSGFCLAFFECFTFFYVINVMKTSNGLLEDRGRIKYYNLFSCIFTIIFVEGQLAMFHR